MTSKSYTGYPQIPELVDSLLAQTSNPETTIIHYPCGYDLDIAQILENRPRPVSKDKNGSDCEMMSKRY